MRSAQNQRSGRVSVVEAQHAAEPLPTPNLAPARLGLLVGDDQLATEALMVPLFVIVANVTITGWPGS